MTCTKWSAIANAKTLKKKTYLSTTIHTKKSVKKLAPIQIKNEI